MSNVSNGVSVVRIRKVLPPRSRWMNAATIRSHQSGGPRASVALTVINPSRWEQWLYRLRLLRP